MYELLCEQLGALKDQMYKGRGLDPCYATGRLDQLKLVAVACYEKDLLTKNQFQEIGAAIARA